MYQLELSVYAAQFVGIILLTQGSAPWTPPKTICPAYIGKSGGMNICNPQGKPAKASGGPYWYLFLKFYTRDSCSHTYCKWIEAGTQILG